MPRLFAFCLLLCSISNAHLFSYTRVRMADGSSRIAKQIRPGDQLWNPVLNKAITVARVDARPEVQSLVEIVTEQTSVLASHDQPVLTHQGRRTAQELQVGMHVVPIQGKPRKIVRLRRIPVSDPVPLTWNFTFVEDSLDPREHFFSAQRMSCGNQTLQSRMNTPQRSFLLP